ncbi:DUF1329 domain-containing protein [Marinicella sp. S1101]|uniref:DUF1329 domain-containing protein n=1 Tax=Marinicella marina TaxID=2996016 RepID=UPI002260FDC1|nr:DUF1329 domain-containing protein [Marinicella marina]MCX7552551.1 DUF1329 domain-containing protein [Marinicella marina]MDJ1139427.1 DUF1329 domain-containing protein [Marinicella marina]
MKPYTVLAIFCLLTPQAAFSQVTIEQAAMLDKALTPMGATRAGDEALGIPAWPDLNPVDEDETALFTITKDNYQQHTNHLTAGQVALFESYPETFSMPIYASRRTFSAPNEVYENTKRNATTAQLNTEKTGFSNSQAGIPFPIPQSAIEVYFNHIARWRGLQLENFASDAIVNDKGVISLSSRESLIKFDHYIPDNKNPNRLFSAISKTTAPAKLSGGGGLVLEPIDQIQQPRSAWIWDKGRRRVVRAPNVSYDQPVSSASGLRTADDTDMINGSPDRFNWQMLEPRTLYIPYNNNRLSNRDLTYKEILTNGHINPVHTRYELHRVWVIRATLKEKWRHLYSQRDFYLDEDSWSVVIADQYDKQGQLFRVSLSYLMQDNNMPGTFPVLNVFHDLNAREYHVMGLQNEAPRGNVYDGEIAKDNLFTPNGLKRYVK